MEASATEREQSIKAFQALGVHSQLAEAAVSLKWKTPTPIQQQAVPHLLQGLSTVVDLLWSVLYTAAYLG